MAIDSLLSSRCLVLHKVLETAWFEGRQQMKRLMALYLALVVVLMTSSVRGADEIRLIKGITYTYEIAPHEIGDPDHTKLLDGNDDPVL
jgi:hypothetical protein